MMQMSDTHPERRRVRHVFKAWRAEGEVQLTPESNQKLTAAQFLEVMGRHRFVLSPRGNGVDAHRTWEARRCAPHVHVHVVLCVCVCMCMLRVRVWARHGHGAPCTLQTLLAGSIPIVRNTALHPLYARLPVLVVADWSDVTPALLRAFWANYTLRREAYDYERLFADHWFARIGAQRARCLAHHHAHTRPLTASGSGGGVGVGGGGGGERSWPRARMATASRTRGGRGTATRDHGSPSKRRPLAKRREEVREAPRPDPVTRDRACEGVWGCLKSLAG